MKKTLRIVFILVLGGLAALMLWQRYRITERELGGLTIDDGSPPPTKNIPNTTLQPSPAAAAPSAQSAINPGNDPAGYFQERYGRFGMPPPAELEKLMPPPTRPTQPTPP
jgi:hypothetical protein